MIAAIWPGAPWICLAVTQLWLAALTQATHDSQAFVCIAGAIVWGIVAIGVGVMMI